MNLSGKSIGDPRVAALIEEAISAAGIDPACLIFELTETTAITNIEEAKVFADRLRVRGCRFALDDFGAGFGSFYYLKSLPFDYFKIDGDFIRGIVASPMDQLVVEAIVGIAQGMGKKTIAEFVPDEDDEPSAREERRRLRTGLPRRPAEAPQGGLAGPHSPTMRDHLESGVEREEHPMTKAVSVLVILAWIGVSASASPPSVGAPPNAHAKSYGGGWECDPGYRKVEDGCVAFTLPANARLDSRGSGWECNRGYRNVDGSCAFIDVPANAFLDARGRGWECDRGYRELHEACNAVEVPANAHPDPSGSDWRCDRGHRRVGASCEPVELPPHAYLDCSGDNWECDRGFRKSAASCAAVTVPAHGFLAHSGSEWECDRGYQKSGASCLALTLPANGHIDYSGNDWACDPGYERKLGSCAARND